MYLYRLFNEFNGGFRKEGHASNKEYTLNHTRIPSMIPAPKGVSWKKDKAYSGI